MFDLLVTAAHRSAARLLAPAAVGLLLAAAFMSATVNAATASASDETLKVGITLHPYYSYVSNIVGDRAEIVPLVDAGFNPHSYELQPTDLKRLLGLDALVVNGIGHDEFALKALDTLAAKRGAGKTPLQVCQ